MLRPQAHLHAKHGLCCTAVEMTDKEFALKLQAELNAEQPGRERSRPAPKHPQRATRAAGRPNGRVKYTFSDVSSHPWIADPECTKPTMASDARRSANLEYMKST